MLGVGHRRGVAEAVQPAPAVADGGHAYWPGWNIARGVVLSACSGGVAGYTLDGWGGVHAFGVAAPVADGGHAYWQGWDIARGLAWDASYGGGYVVDGYGGVHRFRPGAATPPPDVAVSAYWSGWDIARGAATG
ncbi:MAG: hypothetical protein QOE92_166 [Chloroflexota bacterium]|nr:hypothetical protein [Chloroflexota bacterium]